MGQQGRDLSNERLDVRKQTSKLDSLGAITNNLFHGSLQENIVFFHFFKCGGTSIGKAIKSCYLNLELSNNRHIFHLNGGAAKNAAQKIIELSDFPWVQTNNDYNNDYIERKFEEYLLLYYMSQEHIKYIAGHFQFSDIAYQYFSEKYAFVTVLRDPVERFISAYFYKRYKTGKLDRDFKEYLKSENCLNGGFLYVKSLCGLDCIEDYTSARAIAIAKENLHKFRIVGFLEYQEEFLNQFEEQFGRRLKIKVLNKSPKSEAYRKSIITQEIKEEIKELCKPDLEIYQYAVNNFVKTKN